MSAARARTTRIRLATWFLLLYAAVLAIVLFSPMPVDSLFSSVLDDGLSWAQAHGAPGFVDYAFVEFTTNILAFVPIGCIGVLAFGSHRWGWVVLLGIVASVTVELTQGLFLSARTASLADILANSLGVLVGALACWLWRHRRDGTAKKRAQFRY